MMAIREVPLGSLIGRGVGTLAGQQPVPLLLVRCAIGLTARAGPFTATDDSTVTTTHVPAPWTLPSAISLVILSAPLAPVLQGPLLRLCSPGYLIALENGRVLTLVMHLRVTPPPLLLLGVGWLTRLVDGMLTSSGAVLFWSSCKFHLAVPVFDHPNWLLQRHDQGTVVGENRDALLVGCHHVGQDLSTWSGR